MGIRKASAVLWLFGVFLAADAAAGAVLTWTAASNAFPDAISPPYTLTDTASPENPVFVAGALRLGSSGNAENIFYGQAGSVIDTSLPFFIEARVRLVSGSASNTARAPIAISFTTAPNVGNALFIDHDRVFLLAQNVAVGDTEVVDTNDAFHTYRIEFDGGTGLVVRYDGAPILAGSTFADATFSGPQERILWGESSILATGVSDWQSFTHSALAVPEPQTHALLLLGLGFLAFSAIRRAAG